MHKYTILLVLNLLLPSLTFAQEEVLVREQFDYAAFNPLFNLMGGDRGWDGPWVRSVGDDAILRRGSLGSMVDNSVGTYASLEFVRAGIRYDRDINRIQDDGKVLWLAFDINFAPGSVANNVGNVTLTRAGNQVFSVGRKFGNRKIGLVWPGASGYKTDVDAEGLHRLVVKIQFSGDTEEEKAWLWVDPDSFNASGEPMESEADIAVPQPGMPPLRLNIGIDGVQLKVEGTPPLKVGYDNLVLARSFAATAADYVVSNRPTYSSMVPLTIYPNPSPGPVTVSWFQPRSEQVVLRVTDSSGRLVAKHQPGLLPVGQQVISLPALEQLPSGSYFLLLSSPSFSSRASLIISKTP